MFHAGDDILLKRRIQGNKQGAVTRDPYNQVWIFVRMDDGVLQHFCGYGVELNMPALEVKKAAYQPGQFANG